MLGLALFGLAACGDDDGRVLGEHRAHPALELRRQGGGHDDDASPTVNSADAEGRSAGEQAYVVQSDQDVPYNIAVMFDVDLDDLRNYNGWDENFGGFPARGGTVRIPPGAKFIDPAATTTTAAASETSDGRRGGDRRPPSTGDRCAPTYVIENNDAPLVITRKFDITLDQLNAANQTTPNWPNLYTGNTINLPAAGRLRRRRHDDDAPADGS